jgi:ArsR family transcriptional regulator
MGNVMDSPTIIRALGALAQEHRLAAFRLLVQAGEGGLPAGAIAEKLGVAASSLSFHLATLAHAGLVHQRRQSRLIIYTADYAAMQGLIGYLTENCCAGLPCFDQASCAPPPAIKDGL